VRLFAALVPPASVLDHLETALETVRSGPAGALRWVPRENVHLTLAFYGEVPDGALPDVSASLAAVARETTGPQVALSGAGAFSGRTLWVGVGGEVAVVQRLMADATEMLQDRRDDGPSRPHVTVARAGRRARGLELAPAVRALSVYRGPSWRADELRLLSSRLGEGHAGAPRYQTLDAWPLG